MQPQLQYIMGDVFIFDIDGCIMPNIFSIQEKSKKSNSNSNRENMKNLSQLSLYPEFLKFYKINCPKSIAVYFLTGRKQRDYGTITEKQLRPLQSYKNFAIKYYPEGKPHKLTEYFKWKAISIKVIMNQWKQDFVRFHIYDDLEELFPIIFQKISSKINDYNVKLIQTQADWNHKAKIGT